MNSIKKFREATGLKQSEVAEKIGISTMTVSRYETGGREPRAAELVKMAHLFGCSVDDLLGNPHRAAAEFAKAAVRVFCALGTPEARAATAAILISLGAG